MNKLFIVGNLTRDPELRTTSSGISVCSFTVAVNRRRSSTAAGQPEADFFRVSAWRALGENCQKYLAKGRKGYRCRFCFHLPGKRRNHPRDPGSERGRRGIPEPQGRRRRSRRYALRRVCPRRPCAPGQQLCAGR